MDWLVGPAEGEGSTTTGGDKGDAADGGDDKPTADGLATNGAGDRRRRPRPPAGARSRAACIHAMT